MTASPRAAVLDGIRVLDLGRFIAAPYCGMLLADMGAEVIRVEPPGGAEDRSIGLKGNNGENFVYPGLARNKKGVTLDLTSEGGHRMLGELISRSDVFLHNFSPAGAKALKLTYDEVRAIRPDIIYTAISCYGSDGPYAHRIGFDPIAQVCSGAMAVTGFAEAPLRSGVPWVDYSTGLYAALGTMLALRHRERHGEGQAVDCSLLATAVSFTAPMIAEAVITGKERPRLGNRVAYVGPADLYRCRDGYVYVAAATHGMWRSLMSVIGHPELADDPDLQTDEQRFENRDRVDPLVTTWMAARSVQEVAAAMDRARIPSGIYRSTADVPRDPQVAALRMLEYVDLGVENLAQVPISGVAVKLSRSPGGVTSRAPRPGEHNREVYGRILGYSDSDISRLSADNLI